MLFGETNGQVLEALEGGIPHAPLFVAESSIGMTLIAMLVMAAITGNAATRDVQTGIEPLMHAAITRAAYLGGRFVGAFTLSVFFLLTIPIALIVARFIHPDLTPALAGPFRIAPFLQTYFLCRISVASANITAPSGDASHSHRTADDYDHGGATPRARRHRPAPRAIDMDLGDNVVDVGKGYAFEGVNAELKIGGLGKMFRSCS